MHKVQVVINVVLLAGLGFLLADRFIGKSSDPQAQSASKSQPKINSIILSDSSLKNITIGYVNTDTVMDKVVYLKRLREDFEKKNRVAENELAGRMRTFESDYMDVQQRAQSGQLNESQMKELEKQLMKRQEELARYKEQQTNKLMDEEKVFNQKLTETLQGYLKNFAQQHKLKYILGYTNLSGILYANDSLDLTSRVVIGLNQETKTKK